MAGNAHQVAVPFFRREPHAAETLHRIDVEQRLGCLRLEQLSELLDRIDASKYHEKTKKKIRRIAKKANGCVSLAAIRKDCRIKKSDFIKLLGKFEEMGVECISLGL